MGKPIRLREVARILGEVSVVVADLICQLEHTRSGVTSGLIHATCRRIVYVSTASPLSAVSLPEPGTIIAAVRSTPFLGFVCDETENSIAAADDQIAVPTLGSHP